MKPIFIGVSGGAASGKTLSEEEINLAKSGNLDLDHPDAFDFDALEDTMKRVKNGESVTLKPYDPETFTKY
nr:hypothetical transcript [Hymenolepis microstoma]